MRVLLGRRSEKLGLLIISSLAIALFSVFPARAEWVTGVTTDLDTQGIGGQIEYHWQEFGSLGGLVANFAVAARLDADGDGWMGGGVAGLYRLRDGFFVEGSFMPGAYKVGETDLGGALHFRSLIGVGYEFSESFAISITIDHMSNGSTQSENPGSDAITLRFKIR